MRLLSLCAVALLIPACQSDDSDELVPPAPFGIRHVTPKYGIVWHLENQNLDYNDEFDAAADWWIAWRVSLGTPQATAEAVVKACVIQGYETMCPGDGARQGGYPEYWWPNDLVEVGVNNFGFDSNMNVYHSGPEWVRHGWTHALIRRTDHVGFPNP
jgi:hypothetical protein